MYNTKFTHPKIIDITGKQDTRYITVGDNYVDGAIKVPDRWKKKQFESNSYPELAGRGCFGKFAYQGEPYKDMERYVETQPPEGRKKGFGSRDAKRRDEFSNTVRTEQLRESMRAEMRIVEEHRDPEREAELQAKIASLEAKEAEKRRGTYLYDIGRSKTTQFNERTVKDAHYDFKSRFRGDVEKNMGPYLTSSQTVGANAWNANYSEKRRSCVHATKTFYDYSHLQIKGF